jgi:hypothetical protein
MDCYGTSRYLEVLAVTPTGAPRPKEQLMLDEVRIALDELAERITRLRRHL